MVSLLYSTGRFANFHIHYHHNLAIAIMQIYLKSCLEIQIKLKLAWQQLCVRIKSFVCCFYYFFQHTIFLLGVFHNLFYQKL